MLTSKKGDAVVYDAAKIRYLPSIQAMFDYVTPYPVVQAWLWAILADESLPPQAHMHALAIARFMNEDGLADVGDHDLEAEYERIRHDPEWHRLVNDVLCSR
jgi:hypothetical protein